VLHGRQTSQRDEEVKDEAGIRESKITWVVSSFQSVSTFIMAHRLQPLRRSRELVDLNFLLLLLVVLLA
jgi:hypothetical protein